METNTALLTAVIAILGSIMTTLLVQLFNTRRARAETTKVANEATLIRQKLKQNDAADLAWFVDTYFQLIDLSMEMIGTLENIMANHPEINGGTSGKIKEAKACLKSLRQEVRRYFGVDTSKS